MGKILLIEGDRVTPVDEREFPDESKLQDYIEQYPSLIPLSDVIEGASPLLCIGREVPAGWGFIDLLFIDQDGLLTIVETKLRRNREVRREVIGQIIEYASYVIQWNAEEVFRIANEYFSVSDTVPPEHKNNSLGNIMNTILGEEFSQEDFRNKIEQNLNNGRIRLIIGVDQLIEPLRAIVTFLNSYSNFDILLLQVSDFEESKEKRILIPLLFGYAKKSTGGDSPRGRWDKDKFLNKAKDTCGTETAEVLSKIYEFSEKIADRVTWGTGVNVGSFTFRKLQHGVPVSIFTVQTDGVLYINFGEMKVKEVDENVVASFANALDVIPNMRIPDDAVQLGQYYPIKAGMLAEEENLQVFQNAIAALCKEIES
ncbi:hypothetical protein ACFLXO_08245 [Chloroflexota bacterium]